MKASLSYTGAFAKAVGRLPPDRQDAVYDVLERFIEEPALPRLDFRPLKGNSGFFIINARRGDRIILRKEAEGVFEAVDVGPHDNTYRKWNRRRR